MDIFLKRAGRFLASPLRSRSRSRARALPPAASPSPHKRQQQQQQQHRSLNSQADVAQRDGRPIDFAFALDIDGVLMNSSQPLPHATETLRYLTANRIPFILLTNGGGKLERDRAADLSAILGIDIPEDAIQQSHTPWKDFKPGFRENKTVLTTGADPGRAREVLESYGFKNVIIPADILHAQPTIFPFDPLHVHAEQHRPLPHPIWTPDLPPDVKPLRIDAVMILNDPRDWALDIQIIIDVLTSKDGVLGKPHPQPQPRVVKKPSAKAQSETEPTAQADAEADPEPQCAKRYKTQSRAHIPLYICNSDMTWSTSHPSPRFGTGAFNMLLHHLFVHTSPQILHSKNKLTAQYYGKPFGFAYAYAQRMLFKRHAELLSGLAGETAKEETAKEETAKETAEAEHTKEEAEAKAQASASSVNYPLKRVYVVGDNPASDIAGAKVWHAAASNQENLPWVSVLVKTGIWRPGQPSHSPDKIAHDVRAAVEWALKREGIEAKIGQTG